MSYYENNTPLVVFSGKVVNLRKIASESNYFINQEYRHLGMLATLGLAAMGEGGAAATSLQNVSGSENQIELFCCEVEGRTIYGCFSKIFFEDGDDVDVVAEVQADGGFYAYSVRRPIDHRLWLPFHCERGSKIHRKKNVKIAIYCSALPVLLGIITVLFGGILKTNDFSIILKFLIVISCGSVISFSLIFFVLFNILKGLIGHSFLAENIFRTLGYEKPEWLDMNEENSQFLKGCREYGEFHYVPDTPQYRQILVAPCVYHYRHAPEVPEEFKLKE